MAMEASEIARLIKESLPDAVVKIEDLRGDGDHYAAQVVSAAFAGKSRVQQHQMVYEALRGRMGDQLHARGVGLFTADPEVATSIGLPLWPGISGLAGIAATEPRHD